MILPRKPTFLALLFCSYIVSSSSKNSKIPPNLKYEKFGEVLLDSGSWKLITYVDYKDYFSFYEYLMTRGKKLQEFCQETKTQSCGNRCHTLQVRVGQLQSGYESVVSILGITKSRVKRFWNYVGDRLPKVRGDKVYSSPIFYTSPSVNISAYDIELEKLRSSKNELSNDPNQHMTMFELNFKENKMEWLEKARKELESEGPSKQDDTELNLIATSLKDEAKSDKSKEEKKKHLLTLVNRLESDVLEYQQFNEIRYYPGCDFRFLKDYFHLIELFNNEQNDLLEAIKDAKKGILNSYILTPVSLVLLLKHIQYDLSEGLTFPFAATVENAYKLVRITKPNVNLYNNKVTFVLDVPLVESDKFTIHQIVDIPKSARNKELVSTPPYLVVDNGYREYTFKSIADFKNACERIDETKYICRSVNVISEYTDIRTHKTIGNNLNSLYFALIGGTVVLVLCVFTLFVYKKIGLGRAHHQDPYAPKFQFKFTMNKDDSKIRKLVLKDSPQVNFNVKKQQTLEPQYEPIMTSNIRQKWGTHVSELSAVPGCSGFGDDKLLSELRTIRTQRNYD